MYLELALTALVICYLHLLLPNPLYLPRTPMSLRLALAGQLHYRKGSLLRSERRLLLAYRPRIIEAEEKIIIIIIKMRKVRRMPVVGREAARLSCVAL